MPTHLTEDMPAPAFTGIDQNGKQVSLDDYKGKKLVLFFYPEDDTPTCTIQACNLRDNYALLKKRGFEVVGVSPDDALKNMVYGEKSKCLAITIWVYIAPHL
jgi:peroxiredoxin Q/BCP